MDNENSSNFSVFLCEKTHLTSKIRRLLMGLSKTHDDDVKEHDHLISNL